MTAGCDGHRCRRLVGAGSFPFAMVAAMAVGVWACGPAQHRCRYSGDNAPGEEEGCAWDDDADICVDVVACADWSGQESCEDFVLPGAASIETADDYIIPGECQPYNGDPADGWTHECSLDLGGRVVWMEVDDNGLPLRSEEWNGEASLDAMTFVHDEEGRLLEVHWRRSNAQGEFQVRDATFAYATGVLTPLTRTLVVREPDWWVQQGCSEASCPSFIDGHHSAGYESHWDEQGRQTMSSNWSGTDDCPTATSWWYVDEDEFPDGMSRGDCEEMVSGALDLAAPNATYGVLVPEDGGPGQVLADRCCGLCEEVRYP